MTLFDMPPRELLPFDGSALFHEWVLGDLNHHSVMSELVDNIAWESHSIKMFGKEYPQPRLIAWFGDPGSEYSYSGLKMNVRDWVEPISSLREIIQAHANVEFNSVLVNYYRNGNDKVGWHRDDEPELGATPTIASLSLGATRRFKFRHLETRQVVPIDLPAGSLVVMSGLSQARWEHEAPRQIGVTEPRINLTFRQVGTVER
jgi:alkylated DNA repair dioxygenase AlkB